MISISSFNANGNNESQYQVHQCCLAVLTFKWKDLDLQMTRFIASASHNSKLLTFRLTKIYWNTPAHAAIFQHPQEGKFYQQTSLYVIFASTWDLSTLKVTLTNMM